MEFVSRYCLISIFIFSSCAIQKNLVEVQGVDRVNIDQKNYSRPEFFVGDFKLVKTQNNRAPASLARPQLDSNFSNRQIYFLSFYQQYKTLTKILKTTDEINTCPRFHNILLDEQDPEYNNKLFSVKIDFSVVRDNPKNISLFPVLALPYSDKGDLYSYLVKNNWKDSNEHLVSALKQYLIETKKEIITLCDRGVSPGQYIYENLVTHFKAKQQFHGSISGLKALLKVPVLANMVILDNLKRLDYPLNITQSYDELLLERSNAKWFGHFLVDLKKKRELRSHRAERLSSNFIK